MQAPPKCDGCQTLLAIQQEQPHRVETAFSSPPSSADDGLDAGSEIIRKPMDSNVTNLVLSLFIMIMICMVSTICDTRTAQGASSCPLNGHGLRYSQGASGYSSASHLNQGFRVGDLHFTDAHPFFFNHSDSRSVWIDRFT